MWRFNISSKVKSEQQETYPGKEIAFILNLLETLK